MNRVAPHGGRPCHLVLLELLVTRASIFVKWHTEVRREIPEA